MDTFLITYFQFIRNCFSRLVKDSEKKMGLRVGKMSLIAKVKKQNKMAWYDNLQTFEIRIIIIKVLFINFKKKI